MANRKMFVTVLTGLLVGALMGAGVVQFASLTSEIFMARVSAYKIFPRDAQMTGTSPANKAIPDSRVKARTAETRTEKAPTLHGAAYEDIKARCPVENTQCFVNEINKFLREQAK